MHGWLRVALVAPASLLLLATGGCGRSDLSVSAATDDDGGSSTRSTDDDDGTNDSTSSDSGETETTGSRCGDGILDEGEACDPGDAEIGPGQACLPGCVLNVCGDGDVGPEEQCDDGNADDEDGCRNDCVLGTCGDGNLDLGEACDDGNTIDSDDCLSTCEFASCGDGFVQAFVEECDDGEDGNQPFAACTPLCRFNVCGDGFERFDEQCDPGAENIGNGQLCRPGCILNVCGDADPWAGEDCDDGNNDNTDGCVNCNLPGCGDGFVFEGVEECDDGDMVDLDGCRNDCSFHRVSKVSLGGNHTCALFDSGTVQCWGNGNNGRTGHGNEANFGDDEPASAAGFINAGGTVDDLITGISHTCFSYAGQGLRCFGRGLEGQLGYGNTNDLGDDETPGSLGFVPLGEQATVFGSRGGAFHSCATLQSTGELKCWGAQTFFQLGVPGLTENIGDDEPASAAAVVSVGAGVIAEVAAGARHTCVRFDDDRVRCWGEASDGALGYGNTNDIGDGEFPNAAGDVPVGDTVTRLTAGFFHTCVITGSDEVRCWGRGANGRLGYGNTVSVGVAQQPADVGSVDIGVGTPVDIVAGAAHTCVLMDDGAVRCWGVADQGQLGYGNLSSIGDNEDPSVAGNVPVGGPASAIAADGNHTCAIMEDTGALRCWGQGGDGRLGYGNLANIGDNEFPSSVGDVPLFP